MTNSLMKAPFENLCRICSCEIKGKLISVFETDDLLEKITSCLPISIHEADQLPHNVCEGCLIEIDKSYKLINKAQSSESYFLKCLYNTMKCINKTKIKEEAPDEITVLEDLEEVIKNKHENFRKTVSLDLGGSFHCDICGVTLSEAADLNTHILEKHGNQSIPPNTEFTINKICSLCGQLFDCDSAYVLHKCESQHKCSLCNKVMPSKCLLNRHIQHSCKQLSYCPHCHKTFSVKSLFLKHIQDHTGKELKTECLACETKPKKQGGEVMEHTCEKAVEETQKYRCYVCGLSYKREINLARHCLQHEPRTKWKYKCIKCNDVFEKERKLHTHYERVHKLNRQWVCRFCGKALSTKLSLQIHERIHTQVKPYVCEWCGNAFRCQPNLIQHQAMHTGIRRHKCNVCGKMFSRPYFLRTHMRVHTGERPFQCDICGLRFTQLTDMKRHRNRHEKNSKKVPKPIHGVKNEKIEEFPTEIIEEVAYDGMQTFSIETVELKVETSDV